MTMMMTKMQMNMKIPKIIMMMIVMSARQMKKENKNKKRKKRRRRDRAESNRVRSCPTTLKDPGTARARAIVQCPTAPVYSGLLFLLSRSSCGMRRAGGGQDG